MLTHVGLSSHDGDSCYFCVMATEKKLGEGRMAFQLKAWTDAYARLTDADKSDGLKPEDLESLATAAYLLGKFAESNDVWSRAHNEYLNTGDVKCAVRCAFWLGFHLLNTGESARGGGWISRARRLLDEAHMECVEQGYLLLPVALRSLGEGNAKSSLVTFEQAAKIADQFRDADLTALSCLGRGQALIRLGQVQDGLSLLDEAMTDVDAGQLSPIVSGIVYCAVIEACLEVYDLRRAQEWTEALSQWCTSQPDLVPFRGPCLIRRSEIMQLHGNWSDAIEEANRANELLSQRKGDPIAGAAFYQLGELYRLRGDYTQAEEAYRQSNNAGRNPQPGLALLSLAKGQVDSAKSSICRTLDEVKNPKTRTRILPAYVEIMVVAMEITKAQVAVQELIHIARELDAPFLLALAAQAEGSVLLSQGDPNAALDRLSNAMAIWNRLEAPYECARARFLIGMARTEIGDKEAASLEYEAARSTFYQLKAGRDIARVDALIQERKRDKIHGLTSRELEVLRLLATGKTNKTIAGEMFVSERTVDRHVSNILSKLDLPSRAAATAFAYKYNLL
jgi:DNA-binding NarL/FixJ family response regulator